MRQSQELQRPARRHEQHLLSVIAPRAPDEGRVVLACDLEARPALNDGRLERQMAAVVFDDAREDVRVLASERGQEQGSSEGVSCDGRRLGE